MPLRWSWKGLWRAHGYKHVASLRLGPGVSNSNTDPQQRTSKPRQPAATRKLSLKKMLTKIPKPHQPEGPLRVTAYQKNPDEHSYAHTQGCIKL